MKATVYLNEGDGHYFGFQPEHLPSLKRAETLTFSDDYDSHEALELVFQVCNGADPESDTVWYSHGHRSLSVGDVVLLDESSAWACDPLGWTPLSVGSVLHAEATA